MQVACLLLLGGIVSAIATTTTFRTPVITIGAGESKMGGLKNLDRPQGDVAIQRFSMRPLFEKSGLVVPPSVVYNHHMIFLTVLPSGQLNYRPRCRSKYDIFAGAGAEFSDVVFQDGSGYHLYDQQHVFGRYHLVSNSTREENIVFEYTYTYYPQASMRRSFLLWLDLGDHCRSEFAIPAQSSTFVRSRTFVAPSPGLVTRCVGHIHQAGISLGMTVDNKEVCESLPTYLEGSPYVNQMSVCSGMNQTLQKDSIMSITVAYDSGSQHDAMGIMLCSFLPSKSSQGAGVPPKLSVILVIALVCVSVALVLFISLYLRLRRKSTPQFNVQEFSLDQEFDLN